MQLAGVQVGYVADVELDPMGTLFAELRIDDGYGIPVGSTASVVPVGIFGDQAIALIPERPSTTYIEQGDTLVVAAGPPSTAQLLARADTIERNVGAITLELERQLVDSGGIRDIRRTLQSTNDLVLQTNRLIAQLAGIAGAQSRNLDATFAAANRSLAAFDSVALDSTVKNLQATSANVNALTADLRQTTTQLNAVLAQLQGTQGTAGLLINDPGLYNDLRRLATRLDSLSLDFQRNPRRYINLEIF